MTLQTELHYKGKVVHVRSVLLPKVYPHFIEMADRLEDYLAELPDQTIQSINQVSATDYPLAQWMAVTRARLVLNILPRQLVTELHLRELLWLARDTTDPMPELEYRIGMLRRFRAERGQDLPARSDPFAPYAALAAWIHRQRRLAAGGRLDAETKRVLTADKVDLERRSNAGQTLEEAAFNRGIQTLASYLDKVTASGSRRNLRYRDAKNSDEARLSYRFVEHQRAKARTGLLSDEHWVHLCALKFEVNGYPIGELLLDAEGGW